MMRAFLSFALFFYWLVSAAQESPGKLGDSLSVHYRVQVGAFRKPADLRFGNFNEVQRETVKEGIHRYTVGFFRDYEGARLYMDTVRAMGYSDAFVVAYLNGKRSTLKEIEEAKIAKIDTDPLEMEIVEIVEITKDSVLVAEVEAIEVSNSIVTTDETEIAMLKQKLNRITWMKIAIGQATIGGAVFLGIVTGAWVPVLMGAAVVEIYLLVESNYRFNRRDLRKLYKKDRLSSVSSS